MFGMSREKSYLFPVNSAEFYHRIRQKSTITKQEIKIQNHVKFPKTKKSEKRHPHLRNHQENTDLTTQSEEPNTQEDKPPSRPSPNNRKGSDCWLQGNHRSIPHLNVAGLEVHVEKVADHEADGNAEPEADDAQESVHQTHLRRRSTASNRRRTDMDRNRNRRVSVPEETIYRNERVPSGIAVPRK